MKKLAIGIASLALMYAAVPASGQSDDWGYNMMKAVELLNDSDDAGALEYVEKQIGEDPKDADAYMLRAQIYIYREKFGNALADLNKAIKYSAKDDYFQEYSKYWWRASIYSELDEDSKAVNDLTAAYKLAKKTGSDECNDILSSRAQIWYEKNDYDSADADYKLMLENDETDQRAMIGLVRNAIAEGRYEDAVKMADECEKYDDTYEEIYRFRMQAYDSMGETDRAIDDAIRYFETSDDPSSDLMEPILKKHLSYALAKVKGKIAEGEDIRSWRMLKTSIHEYAYDYAEAAKEYDCIEKDYGASAIFCVYRSICWNELGMTDKAVADITRAMELSDREDAYFLSMRADYFREGGIYGRAIEDLTRVIELLPDDGYPYYLRGWCYELSGDDEKAMEDYNTGIDLDKSYPYIYLMRGEMRLKYGEKELAEEDFEEVVKKDTVAEAGSCRQYALFFLGKDEEALEWMEKIICSDPEDKGVYYDKACLLARMGRLQESVEALRTAFAKGYRSFAHIEHDDDMDPIRNMPEFGALISEYGTAVEIPEEYGTGDEEKSTTEIQMKKMYSGVYEVDCNVNGLPLKFILDTGASSVSISSVEATFMLKNNYLKEKDIKGKNYYSTASGEIREGTIINLREVRIGDAVLRNIEASVTHSQQAPLLLGQSVLERFGVVTIDNINSKLVIRQ